MKLTKLGCQYFGHFGKYQEIDFADEVSVFALIAQWSNNKGRSNQGGKSTFIEMIPYSLWGKGRLKKETELINKKHDEDMFVIAHYEMNDGAILKIKRGRKQNNAAILEVSGYEGVDKDNVQDIINEMIGMEYTDFITICYFMQGDMHQFMSANSSQKKDYILNWLNNDYWKILEEHAKKKMRKVLDSIIKTDERITTIKEELEDVSESEDIDSLIQQKEKLERLSSKYTKQLDKCKDQIAKIQEVKQIRSSIKELKNQIKYIDDTHNLNKIRLRELKDELKIAKKREEKIASLVNYLSDNRFKELESKLIATTKTVNHKIAEKLSIKREIRSIEQENIGLKSSGICPILKTECKSISPEKTISLNKIKLGKLQDKFRILEEELEEIQSIEIDLKKDYMAYKDSKSKLKNLRELMDVKTARAKMQKFKQQMGNTDETKQKIHDKIAKLELKLPEDDIDNPELFEEVDILKEKIDDNKEDIECLVKSISNLETIKRRQLQYKDVLEDLNKELIELKEQETIHKFILFMFGKNGIQSNQVESAFDEIETEINYILEKIDAGMQVEFKAMKELSQWETHCSVCGIKFPKGRIYECNDCGAKKKKKKKDELSLKIFQEGYEYEFKALSGGAQVLITLAVRISMFRMLQRRANIKPKFMFFDEILAQLDEVNKQLVLELMKTILIDELGIEQIFIISHTNIRDVIPNTILITRHQKHSNFKWAI